MRNQNTSSSAVLFSFQFLPQRLIYSSNESYYFKFEFWTIFIQIEVALRWIFELVTYTVAFAWDDVRVCMYVCVSERSTRKYICVRLCLCVPSFWGVRCIVVPPELLSLHLFSSSFFLVFLRNRLSQNDDLQRQERARVSVRARAWMQFACKNVLSQLIRGLSGQAGI